MVLFPARARVFLYPKPSRPASGPNKPSIQWVLRYFPEVNYPGCEVDHSTPTSVEVRNEWSCASNPAIRLHGVERENAAFSNHERCVLEDAVYSLT